MATIDYPSEFDDSREDRPKQRWKITVVSVVSATITYGITSLINGTPIVEIEELHIFSDNHVAVENVEIDPAIVTRPLPPRPPPPETVLVYVPPGCGCA